MTSLPVYEASVNCSSWCFSINDTETLTLDMIKTYYVYRLELVSNTTLSDVTIQVKYKGQTTESWKAIPLGVWSNLQNVS